MIVKGCLEEILRHSLYKYILMNANLFDKIFVDTNSDEKKDYTNKLNIGIINSAFCWN